MTFQVDELVQKISSVRIVPFAELMRYASLLMDNIQYIWFKSIKIKKIVYLLLFIWRLFWYFDASIIFT